MDGVPLRRRHSNPIGDQVTKAGSVASRVVSKASSVVHAAKTKAAGLANELNAELDAGTETLALHYGSRTMTLLPHKVDSSPPLPSEVTKILHLLPYAGSVSVQMAIFTFLSVSSAAAFLAVAVLLLLSAHPPSRIRGHLALGLALNAFALVPLGIWLFVLKKATAIGRGLPRFEAGNATQNAFIAMFCSLAQGLTSVILSFFLGRRKFTSRQADPASGGESKSIPEMGSTSK